VYTYHSGLVYGLFSGSLTPTKAGTWSVYAGYGSLDEAYGVVLTVNPGPIASGSMSPSADVIYAPGSGIINFTNIADAYGNIYANRVITVTPSYTGPNVGASSPPTLTAFTVTTNSSGNAQYITSSFSGFTGTITYTSQLLSCSINVWIDREKYMEGDGNRLWVLGNDEYLYVSNINNGSYQFGYPSTTLYGWLTGHDATSIVAGSTGSQFNEVYYNYSGGEEINNVGGSDPSEGSWPFVWSGYLFDYTTTALVYTSLSSPLECKSVFYDGESVHGYAIDYSNNLYSWYHESGEDSYASILMSNILYVTSMNNNDFAIDTSGNVWNISSGAPIAVTGFPAGTRILSVAINNSGNTYYALDELGQLWAWGDNTDGEFGNGTSGNSSVTPVRAATSIAGIEAISTGETGSMYAITTGNSVYRWGYVVTTPSTGHQTIQSSPSPLTTEGSFIFPAS